MTPNEKPSMSPFGFLYSGIPKRVHSMQLLPYVSHRSQARRGLLRWAAPSDGSPYTALLRFFQAFDEAFDEGTRGRGDEGEGGLRVFGFGGDPFWRCFWF